MGAANSAARWTAMTAATAASMRRWLTLEVLRAAMLSELDRDRDDDPDR